MSENEQLLLPAGIRGAFKELFGDVREASVALAPGRINLIGEHTDYNDGVVLPMAINRYVAVAAAPRGDEIVRIHSTQFNETVERAYREMTPTRGHARGWERYVEGVLWSLRESHFAIGGMDILIQANLPAGAGLASSAALELAVARAALAAHSLPYDAGLAARIAWRAENEYVGVPCGIMDQYAVALAQEEHALLLDCRSLHMVQVALPADASIIVMDTGRGRELARSEFAQRVAECRQAVAAVAARFAGVRSLRDVSPDMLRSCAGEMDATVLRRAEHVVAESARPARLAELFRDKDLRAAGALVLESHESLRDLYSVSCEELDRLVEISCSHPSCYGARMTGAGFGGCAIALVISGHEEDFIATASSQFMAYFRRRGEFFVAGAAGGVIELA